MPYCDADGARLFYRLDGAPDGPTVVLSSSLGTNVNMWQPQMEALTPRWRVLRYDGRGHGGSDVPPGPYSIARLGRDVLCLLDALDIERAAFCGLSMGGMVGIWLGRHAGARLERLLLCNTAANLGTPEIWNERIATARRDGMAALVPGILERWFTPAFLKHNPEPVEHVRQMLLTTSVEGYAACCAAVRDMDQRADLGAITVPTLAVAGRHDTGTPTAALRLITEQVPGAALVELDAAHLSNIEAAAQFNETLVSFLAA